MSESPYLRDSQRLGDVIAAIQAMGTYKFYKQDLEGWAYRIASDKTRAEHWRRVFLEHPEFFRFGSVPDTVSLVIRRQHPKRFDVDTGCLLTKTEVQSRGDTVWAKLSRAPLSPAEISALISTAIQLHTRAVEKERDSRWWIPLLAAGIAAVSGIVGTIVGAALRGGG